MVKGQQVRVTIFGMEYTLKSEENPQFIVELANYLNEQMTEISERSPTNSALKIAILAALNITDDLFKERYEKDKLEKGIAEKQERDASQPAVLPFYLSNCFGLYKNQGTFKPPHLWLFSYFVLLGR